MRRRRRLRLERHQGRSRTGGRGRVRPKAASPLQYIRFSGIRNTGRAERRETFSGERILIAEDNDINLEIAETLLESRNLRVDTARDGLEAVERLRNSAPGTYLAVLMDIQMPVMDGLEATRRIRMLDTEEARTIPIIAMSANAFEEDVEKSLEAGMNGHISKPIDIPTLFDTLHGLKDESA
mgnify:CR=1 FL=1